MNADSDEIERQRTDGVQVVAGDDAIQMAIRAGCSAAEIHLMCSYPQCGCKSTPIIVRAALAEYWRVRGRR